MLNINKLTYLSQVHLETSEAQSTSQDPVSTGGAGVELDGGRPATKLVPCHNFRTNGEGSFWIKEADWARRIGMDHAQLARIRREKLVEGEDFEKRGAQCVIWFSESGCRKLEEVIHGAVDFYDVRSLVSGSPVKEFRVTGVPRNSRIVVCGEIRVRVRDNRNFLIGMTLKAIPGAEYEDVWDLAGRIPRYKGRW